MEVQSSLASTMSTICQHSDCNCVSKIELEERGRLMKRGEVERVERLRDDVEIELARDWSLVSTSIPNRLLSSHSKLSPWPVLLVMGLC